MQTFIIGRDAGNQIVLNDKLVSRQHAQLTITSNGQVTIKDLGSSNGTFVNGNRITESNLNKGDIVKCGAVFLDWNRYLIAGVPGSQQISYQQESSGNPVFQGNAAVLSISEYSLKDIFKYLATRIFEIGDLFKTNWDRTSSIWFLKLTPVIVVLIASLIAYSKLSINKFYLSPTILAIFLFGVCPFITVYLLSINKKVQLDKVVLASGMIGFMQFISLLCYVVFIWIYYQHVNTGYNNYFGNHFDNNKSFDLFIIITALLFIIFLVNLSIAFYLFIYKYFISIGVNRNRSIYLIITTICINSFFQVLSAYIIYLIVKDSVGYYGF